MSKLSVCILILVINVGIANATMSQEVEEQCPVCGERIKVSKIISWGTYVYDWDSKYDMVYAPRTYPAFVWISPKCGYAQFQNHFFELSEDEKKRLRDFLTKNWEPGINDLKSAEEKYDQAIVVNEFLGKDDNFWAWFYRVLIYNYRERNPEKARMYAEREIALLKDGKGELSDPEKTRLYLLGEYYRMTGRHKEAQLLLEESRNINIASDAKVGFIVMICTALFLSGAVIVAYAKRIFGRNDRIFAFILLIMAVLLLIVGYLNLRLAGQKERVNDYYNKIIEERISLLKSDLAENSADKTDNR